MLFRSARQVRSGTWGTARPVEEDVPARDIDRIVDAEWLGDDGDPTIIDPVVIDLVDRAFADDDRRFDDLLVLSDEPSDELSGAPTTPTTEAVLVRPDTVVPSEPSDPIDPVEDTTPAVVIESPEAVRAPRRRLRDLQRPSVRPAVEPEVAPTAAHDDRPATGAAVEVLPPFIASSPRVLMFARRIFIDGRDWPKSPKPTFGGYSIGRWIDEDGDGTYDVLEAESRFFKEIGRAHV
mgnify:CR=1 FL=1